MNPCALPNVESWVVSDLLSAQTGQSSAGVAIYETARQAAHYALPKVKLIYWLLAEAKREMLLGKQ